jgi:hypothetical protein
VRTSEDAWPSPKKLGDDAHAVGRRRARIEDARAIGHGRHDERSFGTEGGAKGTNHLERTAFDWSQRAEGSVHEQHPAALHAEIDQLLGELCFGHPDILAVRAASFERWNLPFTRPEVGGGARGAQGLDAIMLNCAP